MIENLFSYLSTALSGSITIAIAAAFGWGILSILLSPCHLSSIPLVIGYISSRGQMRFARSIHLSLLFAIGILITIAVIGITTASMGRLMGDVGIWGNWFVALILVFIGLYLMDIVRWNWRGLNFLSKPRTGSWGAFILGLAFGIGLGPCTFAFLAPVLAVVFNIAKGDILKAIALIMFFGVGHCIVIIIAGSMVNLVQRYLNWSEKSRLIIYMKRISGFLVLLGGFYFIYITI